MNTTLEKPITITVGAALIGAGALATFILTAAHFMLSEIKDDVAVARESISEQRQFSREDSAARFSGDAALQQSIAALAAQLELTTAQLQVTSDRLADVTGSLESLDGSIRAIDLRLSESISRQQEFERSIVARLDPAGFGGGKLPSGWEQDAANVIGQLKSGEDPLKRWFTLVGQERRD
jgi:septal ring factor EnvC (AmiA/AmiB activator)